MNKQTNDITYFTFPKHKERQAVWIEACCRSDPVNAKNASICEIHFPEESFVRDFQNELLGLPLKRKLCVSAIPSLNLPYQWPPSSSDIEQESRRKRRQESEEQRRIISNLNVSANCPEVVEVEDNSELDVVIEEEVPDLKRDEETQCSIELGFPQVRAHKCLILLTGCLTY